MRYVFCVMIMGCLWAYGHSLQNPLKLSIQAVDEKAQIIEIPAMDLQVGESGLVWHRFDSNYASVIAEVAVIKVDSGVAYGKIQADSVLKQKYLPSPTNAPTKGDEVYFRTLNNRAFIIAPTLESYEQVRSSYPAIEFLNSDLMIGYLFDMGGFDPKPAFLNKVCRIYNAGLLFVIATESLNILDCQSLVVLEKREFSTSELENASTIAPFFSRVQYASSGSLDTALFKKYSKQYFRYYDALIAQGKDFKVSKE